MHPDLLREQCQPAAPCWLPGGQWVGGVLHFPLSRPSPALLANAHYFGIEAWARDYLDHCHRDALFRERWRAALAPFGGSWDGRVVVDLGCGPGNVAAALGGRPRLLIGVDVADASLHLARRLGYLPILADAQRLPLRSACADLVVINAALHHCDNIARVLREAARLLRPGGLLITDNDHQQGATALRGPARALFAGRLRLHRWRRRGPHASRFQQLCMLAGEVHAHPSGRGLRAELFHRTLEPLGLQVRVLPHNQTLGAAVLEGRMGAKPWPWPWLQRCSGLDPADPATALTLMCVARRPPLA
ncbi:MAG: class I SAM-dependent methyltransferase [Cyanobacteriota bacterium]|nr:class I SAM-dependent methyltransferase [Cyanobacteriota bacterium]